ncbi:hypothetical protein ACTFIR_007907 [Dictyostelium discoideum]
MTKATFKILLIGETQVGCSTILSQIKKSYATEKNENKFGTLNKNKEKSKEEKEKVEEEEEIKSFKQVVYHENTKYMLDIIDHKFINQTIEEGQGQEPQEQNTNLPIEDIIKEFHGFILVYDITKLSSSKKLKEMYELINKNNHCNYRSILLIGNKNDLKDEREITYSQGEEFAENFDCLFSEISSKDIIQLDSAITSLITDLVTKRYESMTITKQSSSKSKKKFILPFKGGLSNRNYYKNYECGGSIEFFKNHNEFVQNKSIIYPPCKSFNDANHRSKQLFKNNNNNWNKSTKQRKISLIFLIDKNYNWNNDIIYILENEVLFIEYYCYFEIQVENQPDAILTIDGSNSTNLFFNV